MGSIWLEILLVLILVFVNGALSMSELAIVSARPFRLRQRAESGSGGAATAIELAEHPNRFLSTVQIGITLVGILAGAFGGARIAKLLAPSLSDLPLIGGHGDAVAMTLVVATITYLSLVVGELAPKRLALRYPERIAATVAQPMRMLSVIARPVVWLLSVSTEALLRLLRIQPPSDADVTEEEVEHLIDQATEAGVLNVAEQRLLGRVLDLGDILAGQAMTPRHEVVGLDLTASDAENRALVTSARYDTYPVYDGDLDRIAGIVAVRSLAGKLAGDAPLDVRASLEPPRYVPETTSLLGVLKQMTMTGAHRLFVVDEFGSVQGLITLTDVFESIIGDLDVLAGLAEPEIVARGDGTWLVDGTLDVAELHDLLGVAGLPGTSRGQFHTVGGLMMAQLGRVPSAGDYWDWGGFRFEVVDMDGLRVDKVLISSEQALTDG